MKSLSPALEDRIKLLQFHIEQAKACLRSYDAEIKQEAKQKTIDIEMLKNYCQSSIDWKENLRTYTNQLDFLLKVKKEIN